MGAFKSKQGFRLVTGIILLVLGLTMLEDVIDGYNPDTLTLMTSIFTCALGLVLILKYYSDRRKSKPKGQ